MDISTPKPSAIDQAISVCHDIVGTHRKENAKILQLGLIVGLGCAGYFMWSVIYRSIKSTPLNTNSTQDYLIYIFGIVLISILTALYRFHLKEISRAQQNLIAFMRIRIAGNNYENGFATEVRKALTENAFYSEANEISFKKKKMESPVPGHPLSEVSTIAINGLIDLLKEKERKEK